MSLAIFDLDNTLLRGDSDHAWGEFLISKGLADPHQHAVQNDQFYSQYTKGELDIQAYVKFTLGPVLHLPLPELDLLHREFMQEFIRPLFLPKAADLITEHRNAGDFCLIMSATNSFITHPIANALKADHILSTDLERRQNYYTGDISGIPCFQQGKVRRLEQWLLLQSGKYSFAKACFYSDSFNDLPLLNCVATPVAVDPDVRLLKVARKKRWKVMSLRS
jgi:HAD superfamily hydrolase (TIGR01490 family)